MRALDVSTAYLASAFRGLSGLRVGRLGPRPEQRITLYDFEACPFCRRLREAITMLDLEVMVYPCPSGGTRYRPKVIERGGKSQFPYLIDPNTGHEGYESADLIAYLYETYGAGSVPLQLRLGPLDVLGSGFASLSRAARGRTARASRSPDAPLELYSFEASPYCRLAREALCELELPYVLHNVGKRSPSRTAFVERSGKMQVPYLVDPNTSTETFESADIVRYLNQTYAQ
jgi:glutathione S-transferase